MHYCDLMNSVFDAFYESGKNFPKNLLYPILGQRDNNLVVDRFIECRIKRNRTNGKITNVEGPIDIYEHVENNKVQSYFVRNEECERETKTCISDPLKQINNADLEEIGIGDFPNIYMLLRDFTYSDEISAAQLHVLRKALYFYYILVEQEIQSIYQTYCAEFFDWANRVLSSTKR